MYKTLIILFKNPQFRKEYKNMIARLRHLYEIGGKNGKLKGFLIEPMFVSLLNRFGVKSEKIADRINQPNNVEGKEDTDITLNGIPVSMKTFSKKSFPQITTNYLIRKIIDSNFSEYTEITGSAFIKEIFSPLMADQSEILIFDAECSVYYFDKKLMIKSIDKLIKVQSRKHITWKCLDSNGVILFKIMYGANSDNAFQRGIWVAGLNGWEHLLGTEMVKTVFINKENDYNSISESKKLDKYLF